jgi:hypothetical protein
MPFITQGKTNWKFLLVVIILAFIVGGVALLFILIPPPEPLPRQTDILVDGKTEKLVGITLPVSKEEAKQIVEKFCELGEETKRIIEKFCKLEDPSSLYEEYEYDYESIENVNNVWQVKAKFKYLQGASVNEQTGKARCDVDFLSESETATYNNKEYGFEISYPSVFSFMEEKTGLFAIKFPELNFALTIEKKPEDFSDLKSYLTAIANEGNSTCKAQYDIDKYNYCYSVESQNFGNKKTFALINRAVAGNAGAMGATSAEVYFENGDYLAIAAYNYFSTFISDEYPVTEAVTKYNIIQQMLYTLKFNETDATADWKTYRNEEYGFEIKYPNDFLDKTPTKTFPLVTLTDCDLTNFPRQCPDITEAVKNLTGEDLDSDLRHGVGSLKSVPFNDLLQEQEKEQKVGDIYFCKLLVNDCGMGSCTSGYYYTIPKDNKCITIYFRKTVSSCGAYYGLPEYEKEYNECIKFLDITLPNTINQMLSTFRFLE